MHEIILLSVSDHFSVLSVSRLLLNDFETNSVHDTQSDAFTSVKFDKMHGESATFKPIEYIPF